MSLHNIWNLYKKNIKILHKMILNEFCQRYLFELDIIYLKTTEFVPKFSREYFHIICHNFLNKFNDKNYQVL